MISLKGSDNNMKLRTLPYDLSVCKVPSVTDTVLALDFFLICHTDEEVSLVCRTEEDETVEDD